MGSSEAEALNAEGNELSEKGDYDAALAAYEKAAALAPAWAAPCFNIGLVNKQLHKWQASLEANARALERNPKHEGALWNLGISATALSNWAIARKAWADYGIKLPAGEGPIEANFGLTPVRVDVAGNSEVVWGDRIDPCRIVVQSIPFRSSGRRYRDVVLHDGAQNGTRRLGDREVPVFDELQVLTVSSWDTRSSEADGGRRASRARAANPGAI